MRERGAILTPPPSFTPPRTPQSKAASTPSEDKDISQEERAYILASTPGSAQNASGTPTVIPWGKLLSRKEVCPVGLAAASGTGLCQRMWGTEGRCASQL